MVSVGHLSSGRNSTNAGASRIATGLASSIWPRFTGAAESKEAAVALAMEMIRDGRMPTPEEARWLVLPERERERVRAKWEADTAAEEQRRAARLKRAPAAGRAAQAGRGGAAATGAKCQMAGREPCQLARPRRATALRDSERGVRLRRLGTVEVEQLCRVAPAVDYSRRGGGREIGVRTLAASGPRHQAAVLDEREPRATAASS